LLVLERPSHGISSMKRLWITSLQLLLCAALVGCGESGPTEGDIPPDLIVTWHSTELLVDGIDRMDAGTRVVVTFRADGTFAVQATLDVNENFCGVGPDCDEEGTFTATSTEIVFDAADPDPTTLSYTVTETTLNIFGTSDGRTNDWTFVRSSMPELIGTWMAVSLTDPLGTIMEGGVETTLVITFEADGSYRYASTFSPPDLFCGLEVSCVVEGVYIADADLGTITFDPATGDETTLDIQVTGPTAQLSGLLEGNLHNWLFSKVEISTPGEVGIWRAISLDYGGLDLIDDGTVQGLTLDGVSYSVSTVPSSVRFMCGVLNVPPECFALGAYTASVSQIDFLDGLDSGALSLSAEITPSTLRLTGTVNATSADFLYARVPF
jgi:hypothetical protein